MKKLLLPFLMMASSMIYAQVGVNNETPKITLDVAGKPTVTTEPDGVLVPRLTGDQLRAKNALYTNVSPDDRTGALLYVTIADTAPSGKTINVTSAGFYYFDGSVWQKITTGAGTNIYNANDKLTGNRTANLDGKTIAFTNSTGTAVTNQFSVDGSTFSVDAANDRVGIGEINPAQKLDVKGNIGFTGAIMPNYSAGTTGQVLTSAGAGLPPTWNTNVALAPTVIGSPDSPLTDMSVASNTYLRRNVTIPPGKYIINIGQMIGNTYGLSSTQAYWIRLVLSSSSSSNTLNSGLSYIGSNLVGVRVEAGYAPYQFGLGSIIINNTSGSNQTLYLRSGSVDPYNGASAAVFFNSAGENYLYAQPIN